MRRRRRARATPACAGWKLTDLGRGQLLAITTPLFLAGEQGSAFVLPVGLGYRFQ